MSQTKTQLVEGLNINTSAPADALVIDNSGRLLLGTSTAPTDTNNGAHYSKLTSVGNTFSSTGDGRIALSRGAAASSLSANDSIGGLYFSDNVGGGFAAIEVAVDGTPGSNDYPGRIVFSTTADGVSTPTERLRIDSSGRVGIGTTTVDFSQFGSNTSGVAIADVGTTNTGLKISDGTNHNYLIQAGNGNFYISHYGAGDTIFSNGTLGEEAFRVDASRRLLVGTATSRTINGITGNLQLEGTSFNAGTQSLTVNTNDANCPFFHFAKSRGTSIGSNAVVGSGDYLGVMSWYGADGTNMIEAARIDARVDGTPGSNDMPGRLVFSTTADGASSPTERMRITNTGNILIHKTTAGIGIDGLEFSNTGGTHADITQSGNGVSAFSVNMRYGASDQYPFYFYYNNAFVGYIAVSSTATTYATTSDYRLKENVVPISDASSRLLQLKPSRFNFIIEPDRVVDGFLAHEVQDIVPEAISGQKDEVDADGNPKYQGIDQSKLVPLLTAALQEALAEIESLKARVTALEP